LAGIFTRKKGENSSKEVFLSFPIKKSSFPIISAVNKRKKHYDKSNKKRMKYTEEMILRSPSGYCMPFEERGKNVEVTLGYGQQKHPVTGEPFFHHGVDFSANHYLLAALASGTVAGIGNDQTHGIYQVIRYGKYEVTYSHLANVYVNFGQQVKAGTVVALSGDLLHFEVKYDGEELNPLEFLTMLYGNLKAVEQSGRIGMPEFETYEMGMATDYDKDQKEIEELMLRFCRPTCKTSITVSTSFPNEPRVPYATSSLSQLLSTISLRRCPPLPTHWALVIERCP
jgi:hypothetical protein